MGFWGYRPFEGQDIAGSVRLWKEAGFNIGLSFIYGKEDDCPEKMLALLNINILHVFNRSCKYWMQFISRFAFFPGHSVIS